MKIDKLKQSATIREIIIKINDIIKELNKVIKELSKVKQEQEDSLFPS